MRNKFTSACESEFHFISESPCQISARFVPAHSLITDMKILKIRFDQTNLSREIESFLKTEMFIEFRAQFICNQIYSEDTFSLFYCKYF